MDYKGENPKTKAMNPETVYFEEVDEVIICSGATLPGRRPPHKSPGATLIPPIPLNFSGPFNYRYFSNLGP